MSDTRYDRDVVVLGGGPAGLAAAIRARWVKGYDPVPASVAIVDPGALGGLAAWGSCVLTGPSFSLTGDELVGRLVADVEGLGIPHLRTRVRSVRRDGALLRVEGDELELRCLALVLATGFRALSGEGRHHPDGVVIAMKGRAHLEKLLARADALAGGERLVVVGGRKTAILAPLLEALAARPGGLEILLEHGSPSDLPPPLAERAREGRVVGVEGRERVEAVHVEGPEQERRALPCGALFLDYHAFELEPALDIEGLDELGVTFTPDGFVEIDSFGATGCPELAAAGDVTGRYASTLTALGDGVAAGFTAYRAAYRRKFGSEPDLFAYRGSDRPLADADTEPPLPAHARPLLLGDATRATRLLERALPRDVATAALARMDGTAPLDVLARDLGVQRKLLERAVRAAVHGRELTVHLLYDERAATALQLVR